jgi:hypothetical protein
MLGASHAWNSFLPPNLNFSLLFNSRCIDLVLRTVTMPLIGTRVTVCHDSLVQRGDPVDYGGN